jgi:CRP-like cAMP-binding protein
MSDSLNTPSRLGSRFLSLLGDAEYAALEPKLTLVECKAKEVMGERGAPVNHVYFPCSAVFSVLACMEDGSAIEVGTIGSEGFYGIEAIVGGTAWTETTVCQVAGKAMRMSAPDFKRAITGDTGLRRIAQAYLLAYLSIVSQSVACNRLHNIEERFARWVLMTHDRVPGDEFNLTQEFLANMLGVHRPQISLVAGAFQQAGFIKYTRGKMTILDRAGLEESSCECYQMAKRQIEALLSPSVLEQKSIRLM